MPRRPRVHLDGIPMRYNYQPCCFGEEDSFYLPA